MRTRTVYRILEGIFLFILILMIYVMSIFSAKGQMARELSVPFELTNSYANELSFVEERIMKRSSEIARTTADFHKTKGLQNSQYVPNYLRNDIDESVINDIRFPKTDMRRRKMDELQAPYLTIPIN